MALSRGNWLKADRVQYPRDYECGHCGNQVGTDFGYAYGNSADAAVLICPRCGCPTVFIGSGPTTHQFPESAPGEFVEKAPSDLLALYEEARQSVGAGAYTGAVMLCRKMLMNIAVAEGAKPGEGFKSYVEYLEKQGFFSPKSKAFVEYIKDLGNEANHEISAKSKEDALAAVSFVAALLRHNYELPSRVPTKPKP